MNNPLISIVVPCYNQAQYLSEALQSVLDQTYTHWECIVVNDGSPDNTDEVAKEWLVKDTRFKYIQKVNGGLSSARNAGIEVAEGDWIQFLDSDDCIHPDKFKASIDLVNANPEIKLVVSQFKMFTLTANDAKETSISYNQKSLTYESVLFNWGETFVIPIHCGLFNLAILKEIKFDENFNAIEDWIMWLHFFKITEEAVYINRPFAFYRHNQNSMTRDHVLIHENLFKAYRQIYKMLAPECAEKFIFIVLERLNNKVIDQKTKIKSLESKNKKPFLILVAKVLNKLGLISKKYF